MLVIEIFKLFGSIFIDSNEADQSLSKTEDRASAVGAKLGSAIKTAAKWGAAIGAAAIGAGAAAYRLGAGFDDAFDSIAVGTGASGDALNELQKDFKGVFTSIPTDMATASNAIANLNTYTGAAGETLQDMTKSVLEASRLLGEDGVANSQAFGQALQQWQIPAERAPELMDKLFKITQDTGSGLGELIGQLNTYGPVMQNAGFSTEETAELMGRMNAAGIAWSRISPGLNASFRRWAAAGKEPREEFEKVIETIKNAESSTEALTIATEAFGAEGAQRLTTGIRNGTLALNDLGTSLEGTEGLIQQTADETNDFAEQWELFRNRSMTALEPVTSAVFDLAGTVMERLGPVLEDLAKWVTDNMPAIQAFFEDSFGAVGEAITWITDNVIPPLVVAFEGAQTAVQWVIDNWPTLEPIIKGIGAVIAAILIPQIIEFGVQSMINAAKSVTAWVMTQTSAIAAGVTHSAQIVGMVAKWVLLGAQSLLHAAKVAAAWLIAMGPIAIVTAAVIALVALIIANWETISEVTANLWEGIEKFFSDTWDSMVKTAKGAVNSILGFINGVIEAWNSLSFKVPEVNVMGMTFGGWEIGTPNIPTIPLLAKGGHIIEDGWAMVGEQGPELLNLPRGATVAPLGAGGAGVGGINITLHVHGSVGVEDIADRLVSEIRRRTPVRI